ncbi:MAG TPA: response regulator, partial [Rhodospirillales bacterium]|nr:response regulator [Rhodospirillales bacterium]
FALVLVALNLPDGSGLELGGWLRREVRALDGVPILVFGDAWDEARARDACKEAGLQGYLAKPLSIGRLLGIIRELTQQGGAEAPEAERPLPFRGQELMAPPLDLDRLADIADGDRQLIVEIGSLYLATATRYLEDMRRNLGTEAELRRLAHALKGASRNVGAERVAELAATAEEQGVDEAGLVRLERQLDEVRQFFEETLGSAGENEPAG